MGAADRLDLIIQKGSVVLKDEVRILDIGVRDGRIVQLGDSLRGDDAARTVSAEGLTVMAGMIDAHVHLNEPGLGEWEGFESGSAALAAGGCTTYIDMPLNGIPPTVTAAALHQKLAAAQNRSHADYALWGGLVPGKLHELQPLHEAGVIGFKAFMSYTGDPGEDAFREVDDYTLLEGMKIIAGLGKVLALHAESEPIVSRLGAAMRAEGRLSPADYVASRPVIAELEAINRALFYAGQTGCKLHFVHISSEAGVRTINDARSRGVDVTLETCPHYLKLSAGDLERKGAVAKCSPPLREEPERELLWAAVAAGEIDMISSDHSPCPVSMKNAENFFDAWGGIAGAQSSVELVVGEGHVKRGIPLPLLSRLLSGAPAKRFGLDADKGEIRLGAAADFVLIDLNKPYILEEKHLYHRHKHSPYIGELMHCKITAAYLGGQPIYREGQAPGGTPKGQWIRWNGAN
ncbi:allantoinase AllB [Paenibacillus sp. N4]|uniref:allantoinase AllB n=1 Tax=Paenibacillus vietnamensis TaxID=2590547 RepID=UPI001CD18BA0|nr:allantoinase AllB [Paenibacillus vietnamensis]MCA0756532.1 allantoinase AllB [Paenibacillus vietnamensis]